MSSTSSQRIKAATPATLTWQGVDQDGEPADPGTVTVAVSRADGSAVLPAGTATSGTGNDPRAVALTVAQTEQLDDLTVTWSAAGTAVDTTHVEIVGRFYVSVAEVRAIEDSLGDRIDDNPATIKRCRAEVETTIEQVCRQAFVPRFSVLQLPADRVLRIPNLRAVRWTRTVPVVSGVATYNPFDPFGSIYGPWGTDGERVLVGVEHGLDAPPPDLKRAAIMAIRRQVMLNKSGVDPRAISYTGPSGEVQRFPTPGLGPWVTGLPYVDEVLQRYTMPDTPGVIRLVPTTTSTLMYPSERI
jgi:hypothetical protein